MLRRGRDLRDQDDALRAEREGIIFMETSEKQEPITLYALSDGEPIPMSPTIAEMAMRKRFKDGSYMFTDKPEEAPAYKLGDVKCFLHPESWERESGLLEAAGIAGVVCHSAKHPSRFAMQEVAKSKHKKEWQAKVEYEQQEERREDREQRRQQLDATLALAAKAAGEPEVRYAAKDPRENPVHACPKCSKDFPSPRALQGHMMGAHREEADHA